MRNTIWLWLIALPSVAAQVVVTDVTYTHSAQTTTDSHYRVVPLPGTPPDWTSPVDYTHGTAVVRLEVFTKPTATPTRFQICFEGSPSYACTDQAPAYTAPGVYTWVTPFTNFYQYASVNWSQVPSHIALILKDTNNGKPSPENVGATESAKYMPTLLRVTVTLVGPGSTYVPPDADAGVDAGPLMPPDAGPADAGLIDAGAGADAGLIADAGEPDAGRPEIADAGEATLTTAQTEVTGVGCAAAPLGVPGLLALALAWRRRAGR